MIWLLIVFACYGHTNAQCVPEIQNFKTRPECAEQIVFYREETSIWGEKSQVEVVRKNAICVPISGEAFGGADD